MTNSTARRAAVVLGLAGSLALGACSAELRDDADTVATEQDSGATADTTGDTAAEQDDSRDHAQNDEPTGTVPASESSTEPASDADTGSTSDTDTEPAGDDTGSPGDNDTTTFDFDPALDGLTIKALPEGAEIHQVGAYDCDGEAVSVPAKVQPAILVGDCPEVTVSGSGSQVFLDSDVPVDLVVAADDTEVLTGTTTNVRVDGTANVAAFTGAETVEVAGSNNQVAFSQADVVSIPSAATGNELVFLESAAITVNGDSNALAYGSGPNPTDNGEGNLFGSGDEVGRAVEEQLVAMQERFEELAAELR